MARWPHFSPLARWQPNRAHSVLRFISSPSDSRHLHQMGLRSGETSIGSQRYSNQAAYQPNWSNPSVWCCRSRAAHSMRWNGLTEQAGTICKQISKATSSPRRSYLPWEKLPALRGMVQLRRLPDRLRSALFCSLALLACSFWLGRQVRSFWRLGRTPATPHGVVDNLSPAVQGLRTSSNAPGCRRRRSPGRCRCRRWLRRWCCP